MSGLYNAVFKTQPEAKVLLGVLIHHHTGDETFEPPRLRDLFGEYDDDEKHHRIRVHTRVGGGNRKDYETEIAMMKAHPWFETDADLEFDNTYADFWYRVPPDIVEEINFLMADVADDSLVIWNERVDINQRWKDVIASLKSSQ